MTRLPSAAGQAAILVAVLLAAGAAWGLTIPLMRVAVSTGLPPLGLLVWQNAVMAGLLALLLRLGGHPLGLAARHLPSYAAVALLGTVLPGYFSYLTASLLPAGVRALILSAVPLFALPLALGLGLERPELRRLLGLGLGAAALVLLALPGAEVRDAPPILLGPVLLALIAPLSYGLEATWLAWRGADGLNALQLLLGAALASLAATLPLALATEQAIGPARPWSAAEWAFLAASLLNVAAYCGYVWLVPRAGSVFASQIATLVTGFGMLWSMLLLGERYGVAIWAALALMFAGLVLVQPRAATR
ncbi:MAG: DMT family transporter [Amaricoccus sp.]